MALQTASAAAAKGGTAEPDSILVKLDPGADPGSVAARLDMKVRRYLPQIRWLELEPRGSAPRSASALGGEAAADPAVRGVDTASAGEKVNWDFIPRDPVFNPAIKYEADGTQVAWHFVKPNFPIAWDQTTGGGVNVAVIDSEFDTANPDLGPKLVQRYNVASGTVQYHTGSVDAQPGNVFHGSHTSGLVGAQTDNGIGVAGACFECGVTAIKIGSESTGTFVDASFLGDVAEGLIYAADHGASVINMSLGGPRPHAPLADAVNYAVARNAVVVASAGNSQMSNPGVANYPAAYPNVIGVGATNSKDQIAPFSSQGPWVDVSAPGETILSTTNSADPEALTFEETNPKAAISIKSGTSMSSPIVAGLAGLMRAVRPDLTAGEVEALMKATSKDLGIAGPDPIYGAGRIEAGAAVAAARTYVRPLPPPPPPPVAKRKKFGVRVRAKLKRRKGKLIVSGRLQTRRRCRPKRRVVLFAKHSKKPLVKSKTNKKGLYRLVVRRKRVKRKKVRVVVVKRKLTNVTCKGGRSKYLKP